jgi:hypothetical protein
MLKKNECRRYEKILKKLFERELSAKLYAGFKRQYQERMKNRETIRDGVLEKHQSTMILPAIALKRALESEGLSETEILKILKDFYHQYFSVTAGMYSLIGRVPFFFELLRILFRHSMKTVYPERGWKYQWIEDSSRSIALNMESCYYQKILQEHGEEKILCLFCYIDDEMYERISSRVSWDRTATLARGGSCCDFRFTNKSRSGKGKK